MYSKIFLILIFVLGSNRTICQTKTYIKVIGKQQDEFFEVSLLPVKRFLPKGNIKEFQIISGDTKVFEDVQEAYSLTLYQREKKMLHSFLLFPGDSVTLQFARKPIDVYGRGSSKYRFLVSLREKLLDIPRPANASASLVYSLDDYNEYSNFLDKKIAVIDQTKVPADISKLELQYIKSLLINQVEQNRIQKFNSLKKKHLDEGDGAGYTSLDLAKAFDKTFSNPISQLVRKQPFRIAVDQEFVKLSVERSYDFDHNKFLSETKSSANRRRLYYDYGKKIFSGDALEYYLSRLITDDLIEEIGFTEETEDILARYYSEPRDPFYRAYVMKFEHEQRQKLDGRSFIDFNLLDQDSNVFSTAAVSEKTLLLHFWQLEQYNNEAYLNKLEPLIKHFASDTNFNAVSICVGSNFGLWKKELKKKNFFGKNFFFDNGQPVQAALKNLSLWTYPAIRLKTSDGKMKTLDIDTSEVVTLLKSDIDKIKTEQWIENTDGPYLIKGANTFKALSLIDGKYSSIEINGKKGKKIKVATDRPGEFFEVLLKTKIANELSTFNDVDRIIALSDVEGNFDALRALLTSNKVIDNRFQWIFGNGHLVLIGDIIDRGPQAMECLWLIYSLEEKAKKSGGYVHYILGNHEIMNLNNDLRYVNRKYSRSMKILQLPIEQSLAADTELGCWLRSKNVIENIGGILFMHGGMGEDVLSLGLSVEEINNLSRVYYDNSNAAVSSGDDRLVKIFSSETSPFWYRNYYQDDEIEIRGNYNSVDTTYRTKPEVIDGILEFYNANKIVTGHTIVDPTKVTVHFDGKVFNTDTRHAQKNSEALLVDGKKFFRVNRQGERNQLFANRYKESID